MSTTAVADDTTTTSVFSFAALKAEAKACRERFMQNRLRSNILEHKSLRYAVADLLARRLTKYSDDRNDLEEIVCRVWEENDSFEPAFIEDISAIMERDPACQDWLNPFLNFKGFQGLQAYRVAHYLWNNGERKTAESIQGHLSLAFGMDIHPAARIGRRILIDHATSLVIGETSIIGDDCTLLHEVTLGGTGKEIGDRHPILGNNVIVYAGAKILGRITIGDNCVIGADTFVRKNIPPNKLVVGNPAKTSDR